MKLFVYESLSAGGLGDDPPPSLQAEGWAMLSAVAADFARVATVATLLAPHMPDLAGIFCQRTRSALEPHRFLDAVDESDAVLLIAPEFDGHLAQRSSQVLACGKRLLGCSPDAIRATADKLTLSEFWRQHGVPTPATSLATGRAPVAFPAILKPRDGAGSLATRLVVDAASWDRQFDAVTTERPGCDFLIQRFQPGLAASVAFLVGPQRALSLVPTEQILSTDGCFQYQGGRLPLRPDLAARAVAMAAHALDGIEGLAGFVGVDLVLGDDGHDVAIEVNPRLTTSYIGLRSLCQENLAAAWLRVLDGEPDVALSWRPGPVAFLANGQLQMSR